VGGDNQIIFFTFRGGNQISFFTFRGGISSSLHLRGEAEVYNTVAVE
jgi:hypothetical protein